MHDLLVEKRKRSEFDMIRDEQIEQRVTLNEVIKDIERIAVQDFTTLIILHIAATLFFLEVDGLSLGIL